MIKRLRAAALIALALALAAPAGAEERAAGQFDYYVLALSWSPSWCADEAAAGDAPEQCAPPRDLGFTLHGLWPQDDAGGWPEYCDTPARDPSRGQTAAMRDIMGSPGLAWYQWKKHGRCSGLAANDYFNRARLAFASLRLPEDIAGQTMTAAEIERTFLRANPSFDGDEVIVTCAANRLRELRVCLDRDLSPRPCAPDVLADACRPDRGLSVLPPP